MIKNEAKKYNLFILEDGAQGFGGSIRNQKACSFGDVAATSFFPAKPLGCYGDGGAIFTDNDELANIIRSIRVHGSGKNKYDNIRIGINGRLDTIQAAILLEKLKIFEYEVILRNKVASYYNKNKINEIDFSFIPKGYESSWAQFSLRAKSKNIRKDIILKLKDMGIPSMIYYGKPLHLQRAFNKLEYKKGDFPISEEISDTIFSIPMHPYLNKEKQDKVLQALNSVVL